MENEFLNFAFLCYLQSFQWEMNEEMGYFQLGKPGPDDDLYIMNIVLVCVRSLDEVRIPCEFRMQMSL